VSLWIEDGHYHCDRCGLDVGNGSVAESATIVTARRLPDGGQGQVRYDLCRDRPDPDNPRKTIQGCEDRVLTRKALRTYRERQEKA
jgi:hypothetical protein